MCTSSQVTKYLLTSYKSIGSFLSCNEISLLKNQFQGTERGITELRNEHQMFKHTPLCRQPAIMENSVNEFQISAHKPNILHGTMG